MDGEDSEDDDDTNKARIDEAAAGAKTAERPKGGWGTGDWRGRPLTHSLAHSRLIALLDEMRRLM